MSNVDPLEIPGGPRAEDCPSRSARDFLKVTETLEDTWLADPMRKDYAVGDWDLQKACFPQLSKPLSSLAPKKKSGPGKGIPLCHRKSRCYSRTPRSQTSSIQILG